MSRRNFFLGYFIKHENKINFLKLFDEKVLILESSIFARVFKKDFRKDDVNFIFTPQKLYYQQADNFLSYLRGSIKDVDEKKLLRRLYKNDLKDFLVQQKSVMGILRNKWYYFLLFACYRIFFVRGHIDISIENGLLFNRLNKLDIRPDSIILGSKMKLFPLIKKIRSRFHLLIFRLAFLNGFYNVKRTFKKLNITNEDYFFSWGKEDSSSLLAAYYFKQKSTNYRVIEYGELPYTFQINKCGIFGDSDMNHNFNLDKFRSIVIDNKSKKLFDKLFLNKNLPNPLYATLTSLRQKNLEKKVIYVNGVELFASGHIHRKDHKIDGFNKKTNNPNEYLLAYVCKFFDLSKHIILYKEHPLMVENNECLINRANHNSVLFIDYDLEYLIDFVDGVISLPSKVVTFATLHQKPVHVWGKYTIPVDIAKLGYFIGYDLSKFDEFVSSGVNISKEESMRLFKYFLSNLITVNYDDYSSSFFDEKTKLKSIIYSK